MMEKIEIVVGTYENLILGHGIQENVGGGFTLESSFTTDSHRGALRCLAVSPQGVLASSSTDDSIRLHSLKKRKEVGSLFQHDGSVNCIRFFKGHMFSASEDGTICLWRCKSWELLRTLKGHKCHVMAMAVHPTGKLGLSVGSDRTFFTWDLTTGKLAFKRKTEQVAQDVMFSDDGSYYVLVYERKIEVCSLEDTMVLQEIKFESRINTVCYIEENVLAVGGDDGKLSVINVISNSKLIEESFKGRIKSLHAISTKTDILLFVATSNGSIKVFKLGVTEGSEKLDSVLVFESGVRITCMTAYAPPEILKEVKKEVKMRGRRKRKRKYDDDEEDKENSENEASVEQGEGRDVEGNDSDEGKDPIDDENEEKSVDESDDDENEEENVEESGDDENEEESVDEIEEESVDENEEESGEESSDDENEEESVEESSDDENEESVEESGDDSAASDQDSNAKSNRASKDKKIHSSTISRNGKQAKAGKKFKNDVSQARKKRKLI